MKQELIITAIMGLAVFCNGATITVSQDGAGDYTSIQAAVDAATVGDTVIVQPATYYENIKFNGKDIILTSTNPQYDPVVARTVIHGGGTASVIEFEGTETPDCLVTGFTITGGWGNPFGGGLWGHGAHPSISYCVITNNRAERGGGIMSVYGAIQNCTIINNHSETWGGGLSACTRRIVNCVVASNTAVMYGGGLYNCDGSILNCTIVNNIVYNDDEPSVAGGGLKDCNGTITNCIIWDNTFNQLSDCSQPTYSSYPGGGTGEGNINLPPEFVLPYDYHLPPQSPCIDAGTNNPPIALPTIDIEGSPRPVDGNGDTSEVADMGAYEYNPASACIELSPKFMTFIVPENDISDTQTLLIHSTNGATLNWQIEKDAEWVTVTPQTGQTADEPVQVQVQVNTESLSPGDYKSLLVIHAEEAANNPQVVRLLLHVQGLLYIPDYYPTIQSAINNAWEDDRIVVRPGTYYENLQFNGKNITLTSTDPADPALVKATVIHGTGTGSVIEFEGTETPACQIRGFTITGGNNELAGGGIRGKLTQATVSNCVIANNRSDRGAAIVSVKGTIENCIIINNHSVTCGGGLSNCSGQIVNCLITSNTAGEYGGGLYNCNGNILNCTVVNNIVRFNSDESEAGGGLKECDGTITNCIIWYNTFNQLSDCSQPTYSSYPGGGTGEGNIKLDPMPVDPSNDDYSLQIFSPCIDAGTNNPPIPLPSTDIEGSPRPIDGNGDGTAIADMGAYEFFRPAYPVVQADPEVVVFRRFLSDPNPPDQTLKIYNAGMGPFDWSIEHNCSWLTIYPAAGQTDNEIDEVNLAVDTSSLAPATYISQLIISSQTAQNCPVVVNIRLHIYPDDALVVPDKYPTIQDAVDAAAEGNTVFVADGTYSGEGNYNIAIDIPITIKSENGPKKCIIDCSPANPEESTSGFIIQPSGNIILDLEEYTQYYNAVLDGFTVTRANASAIICGYEPIWWNTWPTDETAGTIINNCIITQNHYSSRPNFFSEVIQGAGISCYSGSYPLISNCVITNNSLYNQFGSARGGGIYCDWTQAKIEDCIITNNSVASNEQASGGGIYCIYSSVLVKNCLIADNSCYGNTELPNYGGGIYYFSEGDLTIVNSTIANNSTDGLGGGIYVGARSASIENSIIWANSAPEGSQIATYISSGIIHIAYSDVQGGPGDAYDPEFSIEWGDGIIDEDPMFVHPLDDFHLLPDSPCIDSGTNQPESAPLPTTDLDGLARPLDGDNDLIPTADMGAYEFLPIDTPHLSISETEFMFAARQDTPPAPQFLYIKNLGPESFNWQISYYCPWLEVNPAEGFVSIETDTVVIKVNPQALEPGDYQSSLTVTADSALNSPQTVTVRLHIAAVYHVPADFGTIQEAINVASDMDMIIVSPGTYYENLLLEGKNIELTSTNLFDWSVVEQTVIHGQNAARVITLDGTESESCKISGFTLTAGYTEDRGAAVRAYGAAATISRCIIKENSAPAGPGGGIHNCDGRIDSCIFTQNNAVTGAALAGCDGTIVNCLIFNNYATNKGGLNNCNGTILNCTIADNAGDFGAGLGDCSGNIINCIIYGDDLPQVYSSQPIYSCFPEAQSTTNISLNPDFVDPAGGDYRLSTFSPCIDAATNAGVLTDIKSVQRPWDHPLLDNNGTLPEFDMGAFEFINHPPVADAGPDITAHADYDYCAKVTLDGSASTDPDGDELKYTWYVEINENGDIVVLEGPQPTITLPPGQFQILLQVGDILTTSEPDMLIVTIIAPLEVPMHIHPSSVNRKSGLALVTTRLDLPAPITPEDISEEKLTIYPGGIPAEQQDYTLNKKELTVIMAVFDKNKLLEAIEQDGYVQLTVAGKLKAGQIFLGRNFIKVR